MLSAPVTAPRLKAKQRAVAEMEFIGKVAARGDTVAEAGDWQYLSGLTMRFISAVRRLTFSEPELSLFS